MSGHLLLVGGWTGLYARAKAACWRLTVITSASTLDAEAQALIDRNIDLDMSDVSVPDVAEVLHHQDRFDAVVGMREMGLDNASLIVERLGIKGNPRRPVALTRDKLAMRRHLAAAGLSAIPYLGAPSRAGLRAFGTEYGWPVILKGARGYGSAEVTLVTGPDDVDPAFDQLGHLDLIAEVCVPGPEFSVETFSWQGEHILLAITEKETAGPPSFVETGHTLPARLPSADEDRIGQLVVAVLGSIGHLMGPAHTEVILSPDGPVVVESHTRAGGGHIYDLTEFVTGVDVFTELFQGLAGSTPTVLPQRKGAAMTRFLNFPSGTLRSVDGIEEVLRTPGVVDCTVNLTVGQQVRPPTSSFDRHGYLMARGASHEDVLATVAAATAALKVVVEP